ncbi:putative non-reducing end alpha-L-arabinofuranosidase [Arabidopsis thaliana]
MRLEFKDIVVPAITNLLPEINRNLTPPRELLVDNSRWVLAFTGAYCSAIHLLEVKSHAGYVKEIAYKMIDSVRELVERGMEVGLVTRAFRDLQSIVKKQWDWYMTCECRFLKGLLWRLYAIKGMKMESKSIFIVRNHQWRSFKYVLRRINVNIERSVDENLKILPTSEFNWLR